MAEFRLIEENRAVPILVETTGYEGVRRIADTLAEDICLVSDKKPERVDEAWLNRKPGGSVILCATVGHSALLEELEKKGSFSAEEIRGKRETYKIQLLEHPLEGVDSALVICGSDKRGTIYGMFTLSEYLGVTPLVYFGDAAPRRCPDPIVGTDIETVSKEPSVRYRGFFINDEWPCFGNWACSHFGGVNADMYRHVFEFLLRMKGNYLWPAMWASSFPLDGPGSANEELADIYGVVMGYSHHEPCLRASEEWDKVRGEGTRYGNEWNFYTNEQGLLNYWEDSLKRSGKYENVITIGMRGERDSSMLGDDATVEENINLLKDIIRKQRKLIRENVNEDLDKVPQMLALYKEVEAYFYGDEHVAGLKDWDELDGVICMLCEDNFGHMRTLPTPEIRNRRGGFGMYYHFDYHGGPISYEWVDSTPLSKTWEQMCTAYEYGVRDLWIVNVGDLKLHEVPLTYFMSLAYDFDRWGSANPDSCREFAAQWAEKSFPTAEKQLREKAAKLLLSYIDLNHQRRPEALNENIYHPCHYLEADRMLKAAEDIQALDAELRDGLSEAERNGYYSMVGFSAAASANLLKLHLYAGKSRHYASQGRKAANRYAALAEECIEQDNRLADEFAAFQGGKWRGMQLAPHIGFTKWNEDGCRYPVVCRLHPTAKNRMSVSRKDDERVAFKNYGGPERIFVDDFMSEGCGEIILEVSSDGPGAIHYEISVASGKLPEWLEVSPLSGDVEELQEVVLRCRRELLPKVTEKVTLHISDGDTVVAVEISGVRTETEALPPMTFLPQNGVITMNAAHYAEKKDVEAAAYQVLSGYGQYGSAVKVAPFTAAFGEGREAPELTYRFVIPESGDYRVEVLTAPTNPAFNRQSLRIRVAAEGEERILTLVGADFKAGDTRDSSWCRGVLDQIHSVETVMHFEKGVRELTLGALEAGVVPERIRIIPAAGGNGCRGIRTSYLGPEESAFV